MADHSKPTLTSNYSSFVVELDARFDDLAVGLDPAVTTATNLPTNSTRWSSAANKWQKYNGSAWVDLSALYAINISGNAGTVTNGVYSTGAYSNPSWITTLAGSKITGDIAGNAATATKLATARNINGVAFDGTTAISLNLNNSVTFNNLGTGATSGSSFNGSGALTISYNTIGAPSTSGSGASGTWGISITGNAATVTNGVYNNSGTYSINITGNAATATTAGRAYPRRSDGGDLNFYWSGQSGQPTWLWGGTDGSNMYVYNPSNFNVNYASSAGNANTVSSISTSQVLGANAGSSAGGVGTYVIAQRSDSIATSFGATVSASSLIEGISDQRSYAFGFTSGSLSGTWRAMGRTVAAGPGSDGTTTLFLRIS